MGVKVRRTISRQSFYLSYMTVPILPPPSPLVTHRDGRKEMKGTSKIIMAATLVMVVSLAIVLGLILVLLAELYCSLLLRRRQLRNSSSSNHPTATPATTITTNPAAITSSPTSNLQDQSATAPLTTLYAQGVLQAPRSFLFPAVSCEDMVAAKKKQRPQVHQVIDIVNQESNISPHQIGLVSVSSPPASLASASTLEQNQGVPLQCSPSAPSLSPSKTCTGGEHFMYISNPIYDNEIGRASDEADTPFETPDTSPSRLERSASSGDDDEVAQPSKSSPHESPETPPLTPMKKLPAEASSVSLRDIGSLGTSGSDSNSNNGISSSSSGSPCTSPSW